MPAESLFFGALMTEAPLKFSSVLHRFWSSFSFTGLVFGTLFFSASLSPSLLPRLYAVQGVLSGLALAVGYGLGVSAVWLWRYLELPEPQAKTERVCRLSTATVAAAGAALSLWRATVWQNSIRSLMEMPPIESAYASYVAMIALIVGILLIGLARVFWITRNFADRQLKRFLPPRVSYLLSAAIVAFILLTITNRLVLSQLLAAADAAFLEIDNLIEDGIEPPRDPLASGSPESLIHWDSIGRRGKAFVVAGPTQEELAQFSGRKALRPLRVYAGLDCGKTPQERAQLALAELIRVGAFQRSVLVVATPTGTGWLDPGAVDTLEYLHGGDTAIVAMQYSYLPSWITILVNPEGSREAARALFDEVYGHWTTLAGQRRPKLYLHGLSLGALGSETCADLFTLFEDPIQGGVWSGPPFPSTKWAAITRSRNPGSPAWLPKFRDGSMVRFTGRSNALDHAGNRWGPMRFVYIQHPSDPMTFFSPELAFRRPDWLGGERGADVSPYLTWYPIVTFLQVAFDLPMATSVPHGYGHNIAAASYIDAWKEVTDPAGWSADDTARLKERFAEQ